MRKIFPARAGFTFIELIVVIAVLGIMTTVALSNFSTFGKNVVLVNAAESVTLALRQAQIYGNTTKAASISCGPVGASSPFNCAYGVYVKKSTSPATPEIIIFADKDGNNAYNAPGDIVAEKIILDKELSISLLCDGFDCQGDFLSIVFKRPNPDARIADANSAFSLLSAEIQLKHKANGKIVKVKITEAGQISLK